jgi:hypothetical protein
MILGTVRIALYKIHDFKNSAIAFFNFLSKLLANKGERRFERAPFFILWRDKQTRFYASSSLFEYLVNHI